MFIKMIEHADMHFIGLCPKSGYGTTPKDEITRVVEAVLMPVLYLIGRRKPR
jgi:hypothetical protein